MNKMNKSNSLNLIGSSHGLQSKFKNPKRRSLDCEIEESSIEELKIDYVSNIKKNQVDANFSIQEEDSDMFDSPESFNY